MGTAANPSLGLYVKDNVHLYLFLSVLFLMGVVFGALMLGALTPEQQQDMSRYLGSFLQTVSLGGETAPKPDLLAAFGLHFKWMALIWLLGISVVGLPLVLVLNFLKGMLIGFTVGVIVSEYAWKGLAFAFVSVVPQNLLVIPALLACSAAAITFSTYLVRHRFLQKTNDSAAPFFLKYASIGLSLVVVMFAAALVETYLSPVLIGRLAPWLLGLAGAA
jgi:stage II sporulation protein M